MQSSRAFLAAASVAMWVILADAHAQSPYPPPNPPTCRNTGSFEAWLQGFRKEALSAGISRATVETAIHKGAESIDAVACATRAGSNCGSCRPEIRALLRGRRALQAA